MIKEFKNIIEFTSYFHNERICRGYFENLRFKDGDFCPHCGHKEIMRFADGKRYRCHACRRDFTIKTGTLFGESKIPLQKWFIAIYLLTTSKKGVSSIELAEQVGVTQKTAWFMDHRIREALKQNRGKLFGVVEVDETYIGGRHKRKDGFARKSAIMGMTERGGRLRAFQIPARETHILLNHIKKNVKPRTYIMSDEAAAYKKLLKTGFPHGSVKHGKRHWAYGNINTNSIEGFWALFKRGYHGTYHSMSKKHLQRYINEFVFRFNTRADVMATRFEEVVRRITKRGNLSYKTLTA